MSRRKYSPIWMFFEDVVDKKARCKICNATISIVGGSHSNLSRHVKSKHPNSNFNKVVQANKIKQETKDDLPSTSTKKKAAIQKHQSNKSYKPAAKRTKDAKEIDRLLLRMIVKGQHSFRLLDEPAFKELIKEVSQCPGYTLPTKKRLSKNLLPKIQKELLHDVRRNIQFATGICLTTDTWLSKANDCYIAVTAHYINSATELKSHLLACQELYDGFTAQSLFNFLQQVISDFEISDKITAIVSDNTPEIAHAISQGEWVGIACFAHSLNVTVQNAITAIDETTNKVRSIADYVRKHMNDFNDLQMVNEMMNFEEIKFKHDDPTRWNSTYDMLQTINQIQDDIILTISSNSPDLDLSSRDWEIIAETLTILRSFHEIVKEISEDKYLTLSKVTVLCNILDTHVSQNFPVNAEICTMLSSLQMGLFSCFGSIEKEYLYAESALLDPRFKRRAFRDDVSYEEAVENLRNKICSIKLPNEIAEDEASNSIIIKTESIWKDYDLEFTKSGRLDTEFDRYLNEEYLDRRLDPYLWWKERKCIYPRVYLFAIKRLCIVATSVPCERIFTAAGQIINERRTLLKPNKVEGVVFLNSNM